MHYRRRLPHFHQPGSTVFLTFRLHGTLPASRSFPQLPSGRAFVAMDRLLDAARAGPSYLGRADVAAIVVAAIRFVEAELHYCRVHSWVVMPNHVHLLLTPNVPLPRLTRSLKGYSAKQANRILGLTGKSFWQDESYDHLVRNDQEFERIANYIAMNPVRAGLVATPEEYMWSSFHA